MNVCSVSGGDLCFNNTEISCIEVAQCYVAVLLLSNLTASRVLVGKGTIGDLHISCISFLCESIFVQ